MGILGILFQLIIFVQHFCNSRKRRDKYSQVTHKLYSALYTIITICISKALWYGSVGSYSFIHRYKKG